MDWNNMCSASLNYQAPYSNTNGPQLPSPQPSDDAGSMLQQQSFGTSSAAVPASTNLIIRLLQDKDTLINEKNGLLQEKDRLVSRLFEDKHNLLRKKDEAVKHQVEEKVRLMATIQSLSKGHYEQLREKDVEMLKLKAELANKSERIRGLARALQGYIDREALQDEEEEEEGQETEVETSDVDFDHTEPTVDALDYFGRGRRFSDDRRPYKKRKLTLETQEARLGPQMRKAVSGDVGYDKEMLAEATRRNESRPKPTTWASKFECSARSKVTADSLHAEQRRDALALPGSASSTPETALPCASNLEQVASSKAEVITISSGDESSEASSQNADTNHGGTSQCIGHSIRPGTIELTSDTVVVQTGSTRLESDDNISTLSSLPPDIAAAMVELDLPTNQAYDEMITFASKAFPGQVWKPVKFSDLDGEFELGELVDVPPAVSEALQACLEYYNTRRLRLGRPREPIATKLLRCGFSWMSGCPGSSTAWTASDPKKYACKTCFNRRRACFVWRGQHEWAVLPLPPDTRDPAATYKDDGYYIVPHGSKQKASSYPGVWDQSTVSGSKKRSESAE